MNKSKRIAEQKYIQVGGNMIPISETEQQSGNTKIIKEEINKEKLEKAIDDKIIEVKKQSAEGLKKIVDDIKNDLSSELGKADIASKALKVVETKVKELAKLKKSQPCSYSDKETITIKQWFGKAVYRKVIVLDKLPRVGTIAEKHGIKNIDMVTYYECILKHKEDGVFYKPKGMDDFCIEDKTIQFTPNEGWDEYKAFITIEYTKK